MADATPLEWRLLDMASENLAWEEAAADSMLAKLSARGNMALGMLGMLIASATIAPPVGAGSWLLAVAAGIFAGAIAMSLLGTSIVKIVRPSTAAAYLQHVTGATEAGTSEQPLVRQIIEQLSVGATEQQSRNTKVKPKVVLSGWLLLVGCVVWALGLAFVLSMA